MNIHKSYDERRKSKRFDMPLEVEYTTLTQNPVSGHVIAQNIGRGGISFEDSIEIEAGNNVHLKMNVSGSETPVIATGTIAWAKNKKNGIRLTKISKSDQERMLEFIYQKWLESQQP